MTSPAWAEMIVPPCQGAPWAGHLTALRAYRRASTRGIYAVTTSHQDQLLLLVTAAFLLGAPRAPGGPGSGPPLDLTRGEAVAIATRDQLRDAVATANARQQPATLLLAPGTYVLDTPLLHVTCPGLVIRSAEGNRDAVLIRGPDEGPAAAASHVFLVAADDVVIADLSFGYCRYHGVQVQGESPHDVSGLWVHNCRILNCNEQFIKGSSSEDDPVGATAGIIENCLFEFTGGWAYQSYTGGIDIHKGVDWVVRDNLFRSIRTRESQSGLAEHAVHFWKRCPTRPQNVVVERNWIINCDRGIGFGLGSHEGGHQGGTSAIRNNFVFNDGVGPHTDVGIGLEHADHVQVDNNTVFILSYWAPMEYRFSGSSDLLFRNNLVNSPIRGRDGAPPPQMSHNIEVLVSAWLRDPAAGDLHLTAAATPAIDSAASLGTFTTDLDGDSRPQLGAWDVGGDEYTPVASDPGPDGISVF